MKLIYIPWGSDQSKNPMGYPSEYPRESKRIDNKDQVPIGWIEISEKSYKILVQSLYANVDAINSQFESSEKDSNTTKLDALKRLFDDCEAIDNAWATATNAQKFDLAQKTFRILRKQRRQILDQYRPE